MVRRYKVTREIVTLERMHRAFDRGLMQYGMMRAIKAPATPPVEGGKAEQLARASAR